jgi:hypothetical protein
MLSRIGVLFRRSIVDLVYLLVIVDYNPTIHDIDITRFTVLLLSKPNQCE